jgi:hypothetical protein
MRHVVQVPAAVVGNAHQRYHGKASGQGKLSGGDGVLLAVYIVIGVVVAIAAIVGGFYASVRLMRGKEAADLERFLRNDSCTWAQVPTPEGGLDTVLYKNAQPEASGIEMRAYYFEEVPEGVEDEGVCLSIIDPNRVNGMILNGFARPLDAMQFGNEMWNQTFLGDVGIMERVIEEKRAAWDQSQREVVIGHYSLCM